MQNNDSKIKVLCFGRFYDVKKGGIETHVEALLENLADQVDFINLVPSKTWSGGETTIAEKIPVKITPSWNVDGSLAISPSLIFQAWKLHRQHKFDLIHLHFPDPMSHLASMILPPQIPRIITWHADIIRQQKALKIYKPFLVNILRKAAAIIVATPKHAESSAFLCKSANIVENQKIHVIPFCVNPIYLHEYNSDDANLILNIRKNLSQKYNLQNSQNSQNSQNFHENSKIIFSLGRHVSYKGFDVLLKAIAKLKQQISQDLPKFQLWLGGEGILTNDLKRLADDLQINDFVKFVGQIADEDLPNFYRSCDIFCLPSITKAEAFGIVQIEAMACGKPVISTRLNNGVDYVNQNEITGLIVDPSNVEELSAAIQKLLENSDLCRKFGDNAKQRVQREFLPSVMAQRTLDLYKKVLNKK